MRLVWAIISLVLIVSMIGIVGSSTFLYANAQETSNIEELEEAHYIISKLFVPINNELDEECTKFGTTRALHDFRITEVFYGKVIEISEGLSQNEKIATIDIQKVLIGNPPDNVNVSTSIVPCEMAFMMDREYLVYVMANEDERIASYGMILPPNEEPPPPGMPRSFAYGVETEIINLEFRVDSEEMKKFNQHREKILEAYEIITEWENQNHVTIKFNLSNVVDGKGILDVGLSVEGNPEITRDDLELLFEEIFGDINMRIFSGVTLIRESQDNDHIILPPLKQIQSGIASERIICEETLQLIFKHNDSPVCVTPSTAEKLIERGWSTSLKNLKTNQDKLPIEYHGRHIDPHFPRYPPFERAVYNSHVTVLATIQSIEVKITDESVNEEKLVFGENQEDFNTVISKSLNGEITSEELGEIMKQHRIVDVEYFENKVPHSYITLKIDKYLKDETEKFTDTLVIKVPADGAGIKENEKVWYQSQNLKSPIGEQAIYMLINYSILSEKNLVKGDFENVYTLLEKYEIDDNNTIQSMYSQKVLKSINQIEQKTLQGNYTLENSEQYNEIKQWVLPISLNDVIVRASELD